MWFLSQGAHTLVGKPYINHEEFWEDKLENVCKHITGCASCLPLCCQIHSLPSLAQLIQECSANNIVQASLPSDVFMDLTNGSLEQKIGASKAERGQNNSPLSLCFRRISQQWLCFLLAYNSNWAASTSVVQVFIWWLQLLISGNTICSLDFIPVLVYTYLVWVLFPNWSLIAALGHSNWLEKRCVRQTFPEDVRDELKSEIWVYIN